MKKAVSILATGILAVGIVYMLMHSPKPNETIAPAPDNSSSGASQQSVAMPTFNVTEKDGVQYVMIAAKGGYYPEISIAKGGMPTKLIVKTDGTYDCSLALVVRSAGYRGMLPWTGETAIDLSSPKIGETVQGVCSMGMYGFAVKFR